MFDQPFNARSLHALGVAPAPQPHRTLTPQALAQAIRRAMSDPNVASREAEVGGKVREERGVAAAVEILESLA
jgi:sterol 3beta-glucosyltransferase